MINTINFNIQRKCPSCGRIFKLDKYDFVDLIKRSDAIVVSCHDCERPIFITKKDITTADVIEDTNYIPINWVESMLKKDSLDKKLIEYPKKEKAKFKGHNDFSDIYDFFDNLILLIENNSNHNHFSKTNIPCVDVLDEHGHVINHKDFYIESVSDEYITYMVNIRIHEISGRDNRFVSRFKACYNFINKPDVDILECKHYEGILDDYYNSQLTIHERVKDLDNTHQFITRALHRYTGLLEIYDKRVSPRDPRDINSKYNFLYMYSGIVKESPSYGGSRDAKVINAVFEMKIDKDTGRAINFYKDW